MPDIKWFKLTTDMFDDEKIKLIENLPDRDSILIIWIKLIALATKLNRDGYIYLTEQVPYTDEMLATVLSRPVNTVRLALSVFNKYEMIELGDAGIYLPKWGIHQNIDGLMKIREQTRLRVARLRDRNTQVALRKPGNVTGNAISNEGVTLRNATDKKKNRIDKEYIYTPLCIENNTTNNNRKMLFEELKKRRGCNSPESGKEVAGINWMLKEGYSVEQILKAYDILKKNVFWADKFLGMQSVRKQIGELSKNGKLKSGHEKNGRRGVGHW